MVLPVVMVVHSAKCVMHAREEGQGLSFPCSTLIAGFGYHSPLDPLLSHFTPGLVFLRTQLQSSDRRDAEGVLLRQSWYWNKPLRLSSAQIPSPNV